MMHWMPGQKIQSFTSSKPQFLTSNGCPHTVHVILLQLATSYLRSFSVMRHCFTLKRG